MRFDYDLVILGGSPVAREAALLARSFQARVALIEPEVSPTCQQNWLPMQGLLTLAKQVHTRHQTPLWGLYAHPTHPMPDDHTAASLNWAAMVQWAQERTSALSDLHAPEVLMAQGIDYLVGVAQFHGKPQLAVEVGGRSLQAHAYLIATGSSVTMPSIEGLASTNPITPEQLWQSSVSRIPHRLIILGAQPQAVEFAQTFHRLGSQVTLISRHDQILPYEDREAAYWIQAQLEAEGIQVLTGTPVTQVRQLGDQTWIQAGIQALETDDVFLATRVRPQIQGLNLESVGVEMQRWGIPVNRKLQSTHPRIYACGDSIGGYPFPHLAQYEATIAVHNALFLARSQTHYNTIPWAIFTDPELVRVGLTETQARQRYGDEIRVLREYFKTNTRAHLQGTTTGLCKVIVQRDGTILGAHLVGAEAREWVGAIALAMQHHLPLQKLASYPAITPSFSTLIHQIACQWQQQKRMEHPWMNSLLDFWFHLRRA